MATPEALQQAVVGITFHQGRLQTVLPSVPADADLVPTPYELRMLSRPRNRVALANMSNFKLYTLEDTASGADGAAAPAAAPDAPPAAPAKPPAKGAKAAPEPPPPAAAAVPQA
jgi:hypothetical protein